MYMKKVRYGFTIAEVLAATVIIALVVAFTMPVIKQNRTIPIEAPFKYVAKVETDSSNSEYYNLAEHIVIYSVPDDTGVAVFGASRVPLDTNIAAANRSSVFTNRINPKISVVASNRLNNPLASRHMLDFYEQNVSGSLINVGKVSFDNYLNMSLGLNTMATMTESQALPAYTWPNLPVNTYTGTVKNAANTDVSVSYTYGINTTTLQGVANTAVGQYAMGGSVKNLTSTAPARAMTGSGNTAYGAFALKNLTTGSNNTALGLNSLTNITTNSNNTAAGHRTLQALTTGSDNTAIGYKVLSSATTGSNNAVLGSCSLPALTSGNRNTILGQENGYYLQTGDDNVLIGRQVDFPALGSNKNIFIGNHVFRYAYNPSCSIAIGNGTCFRYKEGSYNISLGAVSTSIPPVSGTTGSHNIGIGTDTLIRNKTGGGNITIGTSSLTSLVSGVGNIAIGNGIAGTSTMNNKLYIGGVTAYNASTKSITGMTRTSDSEILIYGDMVYNAAAKTPLLKLNTLKTYIGLGDDANTYFKGKASIVVGTKIIPILTIDDAQAILDSATANSNVLSYTRTPATIYSDARLKDIIGDNTAGLKEIQQLSVKNYTMKNDKKKEPLVGVIAQELQKVFPNSVFEGRDGYLRIKRDEIFYACVNAIKELAQMFENIKEKIALTEEKIFSIEKNTKTNEDKISEIEKETKLIEARLSALEDDYKTTQDRNVKIRN